MPKLSISDMLKRSASYLPSHWQNSLRHLWFRRLIRQGRFSPSEPDFHILDILISPGAWVVDIGANIGQYTATMSELVGQRGRVLAFEPIPASFRILSRLSSCYRYDNVTLLQIAVSDRIGSLAMTVPTLDTGLKNYYEAHLDPEAGDIRVLALPLDIFAFGPRISLVKIDAEGHEPLILEGMMELLKRDWPVLIVETCTSDMRRALTELGYSIHRLPGSPNRLLCPSSFDSSRLEAHVNRLSRT